jgi:hypothetical protein
MNIDLSQLSVRGKKKIIRERLHRFNWIKVSEESEYIWVSIESEREIRFFIQWISEQPIHYPAKVVLFDSQWHEISNLLSFNEFDIANLFKIKRTSYVVSNNMEWTIEYSPNIQVARFGTMNV